VVRRFSQAPVFYAWAELDAVLRAPPLAVELPMDAANAKFFAFCAIGNPQAFFEDLERWNFQLVGRKSFRDHHRYTPAEIAELERNASAAGADALLCTEKDVFNLRDNPPTKLPVYACRIGLKISDAQGFWDAVMAAVERRRNVQRL
jgi:tetraacyldisaccharide 4'-kinase